MLIRKQICSRIQRKQCSYCRNLNRTLRPLVKQYVQQMGLNVIAFEDLQRLHCLSEEWNEVDGLYLLVDVELWTFTLLQDSHDFFHYRP